MTTFDAEELLRGLTGGMPIEAFNDEVRERRAVKFESAIGSDLLDELFSLRKLESLIGHEAILLPNIDIFDETNLRRLADVQRKSGKSSVEVVTDSLRQGSTIRIRDIDKFDARLNRFACEVRRRFAAQSDINVYLTPPGKSGFPAHFDITDVFIVQCRGSKEWRISRDYTNKAELPLTDTNWDPDRFRPSADAEAITLRAGDVLYLPRGAMHQTFCTERESMHLTISIAPLTFADLLAKALKLAAETDIELRRRIPWPIHDENIGYDELARTMREQMRKLPDQVDLRALLNGEHRSLLGEKRVNSGELESVSELESAIKGLLQ